MGQRTMRAGDAVEARRASASRRVLPTEEVGVPLRVVMRRTGLSADTLRVWERRHSAVSPLRTEGNARRYRESDIERLILLRDVTARGHLIGEAASLSDDRLRGLLRDGAEAQASAPEAFVTQYMSALLAFDFARSAEVLARAASLLDTRTVAIDLVGPLLRCIGEFWHDKKIAIAQEHAASEQIRLLCVRLLPLVNVGRDGPRVVLAAPSGHKHELGLHVGALLAARLGYVPVVLGADTPLDEIMLAAERTRARAVVVAVVLDVPPRECRMIVEGLRKIGARRKVLVGTHVAHPLAKELAKPVKGAARANRPASDVSVVDSFESFEEALRRLDD